MTLTFNLNPTQFNIKEDENGDEEEDEEENKAFEYNSSRPDPGSLVQILYLMHGKSAFNSFQQNVFCRFLIPVNYPLLMLNDCRGCKYQE